MITIAIRPARRWFGGRRQYRYCVLAGNGRKISDQDTFANVGDIKDILTKLVASEEPVRLVYPDGTEEQLR